MLSINRKETFPVALFLLILLVPLGKYSINFGFALKPYMIFLIIFFIIHLSSIQFQRLQLFECGLLMFYLAYCLSGAFALYGSASLRIICGITLYLCCFFLMKSLMSRSKGLIIERALSYAGILFNIGNLIFYFLGLKKLNFILQGDGVYSMGVFMDREYPRLIGMVADPNYLVFYNTLFFTYFLCNFNVKRNRLGLILCILASLLTFSRGGLAAYIVIFILYIAILNNPIKQVKLILGALVSVAIALFLSVTFFSLDIYSVIESRMQDFSSDGGSGRFELWNRAWHYFTENPWLGIGASNFLPYNQYQFGDSLQVHNTFLEILSESGAIGFFCFSLFLLFVVVQLFQRSVHRKKPYLFLAFFGFILQMVSLSVIINDMFFMYLAILAVYFQHEDSTSLKVFNHQKETQNILREGVSV